MTARLIRCGALAAIVLTLGWLVAGSLQTNADVRRGTISDLGAADADKAWVWNVPLTVGGVLVAAFAIGLHRALRPGWGSAIAAALIAVFGVGLALEGALFHLDCRETVPTCAARASHSWRHTAHEIESGIGILALVVAIVVLALRFRREPRWRSLWLASLSTAVAFVVLSAIAEDSAWEGLVQRLLVTVLLGWIAVVAWVLSCWADFPARSGLRSLVPGTHTLPGSSSTTQSSRRR